jgi:hypothetical protein
MTKGVARADQELDAVVDDRAAAYVVHALEALLLLPYATSLCL